MVLKIAATGFVDEQGGSVTSANAIFLRGLLDQGAEVHFFSKPSFVDPRPAAGNRPNFHFHDVTNTGPDRFRARVARVPILGQLAGRFDAATYEKLLVKRIGMAHHTERFDLCLWLGAYASGRVPGLKSVSFAQGPPGTDARSFLTRKEEIASLAGSKTATKWGLLAKTRLSKLGLPNFSLSDYFIVGSQQSIHTLAKIYGVPQERMSAIPYPIDLKQFHLPPPGFTANQETIHELNVLWLGRIVPRKRLDVFLNGAALAIEQGVPVRLTIAGQVSMLPEYEKLITGFPFPDKLNWRKSVPRLEVPQLMWEQDVLAQPSDEENFGSSVAEAQACGLPVIVGQTNGNADYLCPRSIHLADDSSQSFAAALQTLFDRKTMKNWGRPEESRQTAEANFSPEIVNRKFLQILEALV